MVRIAKNGRIAVAAVLIAAVLLLLLLSGAQAGSPTLSAEECYRNSAESLLYLRSYYKSGGLKTTGSGFVVSESGLVVTAAHVIKGGDKITAVAEDGSERILTLVQSNEETDLAFLRLPEGGQRPLKLASRTPNPGAVVRAMGYPIKGTGIITEGLVASASAVVSGKSRMLVTCDIVSGMSGGPILNECGEVVGVVSGSVRTMTGIHLSVLSDELYSAADVEKSTE